ncbi:MAG: N-formylglutamate amidohydrolase [Alphaproteobacteria bacterium]
MGEASSSRMPPPAGEAGLVEVLSPSPQTVPFVFASPHSGSTYLTDFLEASALDPATLRRSEDCFVDRIFGSVPAHGAPMVRALFPRAYVDVNREPYELDPGMFEDPLPDYANTRSVHVAAGIGTIARNVAADIEIYARKLRFAEAEQRIETCYRPYHRILKTLIHSTWSYFGCCVLVDCHSMPPGEIPIGRTEAEAGVDFVLGDRFGSSCAPALTLTAEAALTGMGYRVARNIPYSGGYTTRHYGRPRRRVHVLQIEINRKLYLDNIHYAPLPSMATLTENVDRMVAALVALTPRDLEA